MKHPKFPGMSSCCVLSISSVWMDIVGLSRRCVLSISSVWMGIVGLSGPTVDANLINLL